MAVPETAVLQTVANLDTLIAVVECQQPEADLYRYDVVITMFILSLFTGLIFYSHKHATKYLFEDITGGSKAGDQLNGVKAKNRIWQNSELKY